MDSILDIPKNLPLLVGLVSGDKAAAVEKVLKGCPLQEALAALGKFWKIKVWFNQEVEIKTINHVVSKEVKEGSTYRTWKSYNKSNVQVFNSIVFYRGQLLYCTTRKSHTGYSFPSLDSVIKYEPVIETSGAEEFSSLAEFASRFDRRFINESEIQSLWNSKSAQHGGRYKPSDFRRFGHRGKQVMERFLQLFVDVNTEGKCYSDRSGHKCLEQYYATNYHSGRDIRITHTLGLGRVGYASEFMKCGNGSYGLVANKNEFIHLEDD
jgi:hypothetical protein